ncbi:MAG TPA: hypothetical protein VJT75_13245 [Thermoleophilaceae bacterium]|nr:hypothetical protein [Thermoleophilaceae bacterium]
MTRLACGATVLALLAAAAGCGGSDEADDKAPPTTAARPNATAPGTAADTPLVRCLDGQDFITVKPGPGGVRIVTTDKGERAVVRTYDSLSDALRAARKADLDLDQVISRQTIDYEKPGTGQIKIAVETCQ